MMLTSFHVLVCHCILSLMKCLFVPFAHLKIRLSFLPLVLYVFSILVLCWICILQIFPLCTLCFYLLNRVFYGAKVFNFDKPKFVNFSLMEHVFGIRSKSGLPSPR